MQMFVPTSSCSVNTRGLMAAARRDAGVDDGAGQAEFLEAEA
jgi:hypothetical protein